MEFRRLKKNAQMLHGAGMITYIYPKNGPVMEHLGWI